MFDAREIIVLGKTRISLNEIDSTRNDRERLLTRFLSPRRQQTDIGKTSNPLLRIGHHHSGTDL
jgi:hypothetical protein